MLEQIADMSIEEAVMFLLTFEESLQYNKAKLLKLYHPGTSEETCIALRLCGTSGEKLALGFMQGKYVKQFLLNVSFCTDCSIPLIMRAIQIHLAHVKGNH